MNFKKNLKTLRIKKGYTQEQLAKELKIPLGTLRNWEQGFSTPKNIETLELLIQILECDYNDLLGDDEQ